MHSICKKEALLINNGLLHSNHACIARIPLLWEAKQKSLLLKAYRVFTQNKGMTFNTRLLRNNLQDQGTTVELSSRGSDNPSFK